MRSLRSYSSHREAKGSGTIITFAQFLFIASEGFIATANFGREKRIIPLRYSVTIDTIPNIIQRVQ